jgi:predicted P-loop ATPase
MTTEEILQKLHDNFSIFPVKKDKSPVTYWATYRDKKIKFEQLLKHKYFAVVCGFDNLEVIDIDNHFDDADMMYQFVIDNLPQDMIDILPVVKTKGGGYHIYYKCSDIEGNQKLASRINSQNRPETLIETRGAGGYVVCPPTDGYNVINNSLYKTPKITPEQRDVFLSICRSFNEVEPKKTELKTNVSISDETPGSKYISDPSTPQRTIDLLLSHGWRTKDNKHFKRPGKETDGISATFGKVGVNKFYVFSSNAYPFEPGTSYSMWGVLAMLEYNGDFSAAAKKIASDYGMTKTKREDISPPQEKDGKPKKITSSFVKWMVLKKIIKEWELKFRFNELTKIIEFKKGLDTWQQLGLLPNDIIKEMEVNRGVPSISLSKVIEMLSSSDICEVYNPINHFFKTLPVWDGIDHIEELCKYINLQEGENEVYFSAMLKKHLFRTVKCATERDYINRIVFVFYGPQEIGKTLFFKWLCPGEIYDDEMIDPASRDSLLKLGRYMMINLDELDSLQKKEVARLKAFISKGEIKTRVAYGRFDEMFVRVASFFASTNRNDILADESNTRWMILKVKDFNWQGYTQKINPLQVWAQAVATVKADKDAGELSKDEKKEREARNSQLFLETSLEREILLKFFEEGNTLMTASDIKMVIEEKLYPQKLNMYQLVRELRRIFGEPKMTKNDQDKTGRYYHVKTKLESDKDYNSYEEKLSKAGINTVGKNLPF